jgi:transcriptional regulator with XRE-family HTH domain
MTLTEVCAKKLKNLREYNNYTQSYVADQLELSQNAYSLLEKGTTKITLDRLEELAQFYKTSPIALLNEEPAEYSVLANSSTDNASKHSNYPPNLSVMEKRMYEQTINRLESNIEKLYDLITELTKKITIAPSHQKVDSLV